MYYNLMIGGTLYTDVKSITCAPEYDPTCASLPICQFEAEFNTSVPASSFMGATASIVPDYNGNGTYDSSVDLIVGGYNIEEVKQVSDEVVYILARSWLSWLDKRVLPAELFSENLDVFLCRLFRDQPVNDGAPIWGDDETHPPIYYDISINYQVVSGYCPEQTARERLQWLCQARMLYVVQWDNTSYEYLYVARVPDHPDVSKRYTRILPEYTYSKPVIRKVTSVNAVTIASYSDFTTTFHDDAGWESVVTGYEYELAEDGVIPIEQRLCFQKHTHRTYNTVSGDESVVIEGNTLLENPIAAELNAMPAPFFRGYEVELECLQLWPIGHSVEYFLPGSMVEFYTDPKTMYKGIVKSASFTFGLLAKAKLVISTDLVPMPMSHITVRCVYRPSAGVERLLCTRHYWINRDYGTYTVYHTQMREYVGDRLERFTPSVSSSTISITGAEHTLTALYNRA